MKRTEFSVQRTRSRLPAALTAATVLLLLPVWLVTAAADRAVRNF